MIELQALVDFLQVYSYQAIFGILILCGLGLPIPEDISLVAGGIISGIGYANVHLMFILCMVGVLLGDSLVYNLGRISGDKLMSSRLGRKITSNKNYPKVEGWFEKYGLRILFAARFMPGLRALIFFYSGATKTVSYVRFIMVDGFAAIISVPLWVYLGFFGANNREWLSDMIGRSQFGILMALGTVITLFIFMKYFKKRVFAFARARSESGVVTSEPVSDTEY